ncbi:hypothetical protein GLYMA_08G185700v4 [Glycine max]|uniref:Uncharacterized protein n=6 Tax=Glycine subgen. Soja TaxID=1462606 RepID=I1KUL0_SOYBN|nr:uncharacterized protein LOC100794179 isoform X1 [Glycine max]XP_028244304.1 uncharacterized protein LOC114422246 isoform X1 [Glycine soja]KRH44021.1 hypothetical protein GLYMA_08G185700v4 [Glycine max]RZB97584.1 hypothetical protein D0Y65_020946 [Glycine soja]|eukprot:XP_006585476.1 uncharacterized protein LOC100794179 isoform X1 [Glycine max]
MGSKFPMTQLGTSPGYMISPHRDFCVYSKYSRRISSEQKFPFKFVAQSLGHKWKLNDISTSSIQERLNVLMSRTQNFWNEVTFPLAKPGQSRKPDTENDCGFQVMEDIFMIEQTMDRRTPCGVLSLAVVICIEQFSRMNGLTGKKMQKIFEALVPESVYNDARNLVEYCCFRFLSRDGSDIHPSLQDPAFQRLIFITMLAWENPYTNDLSSNSEKASLQNKLVTEEAFVRLAPAISGVVDRPTVHNLFKALAGDQEGISVSSWLNYINEFVKVRQKLISYQIPEFPQLSEERILCIGSNSKRPVLKWENNMAWPGKLTLTDKAIYFEAVGILAEKRAMRLDLTHDGLQVEKAKVGPLGSALFDSAVSVSSGSELNRWVLEFIDLGGEMRRDVWHAFINEVIALHRFIREYGPDDSDESLFNVYGARKGKDRATTTAINGIARLQVLQYLRKLLDDPTKLVQFSYLQNAPHGDIVLQTLAVNYWGGPLVTGFVNTRNQPETRPSDEIADSRNHVFDIDGSVYLQKWMKSPSWGSSISTSFWKNISVKGLILSKNLVVADLSLIERAAKTSKHKYHIVEKTQATIDAATLQGIPSNIDLFKELVFPFTLIVKNFEKLRHWEEPHLTVAFLGLTFTIIYRNLLSYMFPVMLMILAVGMLTIRALKEQGRLGRSFGEVTIRDQPPSNTIQKIIAVKDAMRDVENFMQQVNVSLLKIRSILLSGHPQITTEVALVLISSATILLIVPFKYIFSFLLFDMFTRELEFRREMVKKFRNFLRERWHTVPAVPVSILPFENEESRSEIYLKEMEDQSKSQGNQSSGKSR